MITCLWANLDAVSELQEEHFELNFYLCRIVQANILIFCRPDQTKKLLKQKNWETFVKNYLIETSLVLLCCCCCCLFVVICLFCCFCFQARLTFSWTSLFSTYEDDAKPKKSLIILKITLGSSSAAAVPRSRPCLVSGRWSAFVGDTLSSHNFDNEDREDAQSRRSSNQTRTPLWSPKFQAKFYNIVIF